MIDELPIFASLDFNHHSCSCCGKAKIKRTVEICGTEFAINLGVTCAGSWFDVNMSGNPYKAIKRLNRKLRELSNEQIEEIVLMIKESQDDR